MQRAVDLFSALSDPTRLRIVALVATMELSVGELAQLLEQSQPRVSRHVRILCEAGLVRRRREGSWVFVAPGSSALAAPLESLLAAVDPQQAWRDADEERLAAIRAERAAFAQRYFDAHAQEWDAIRSLHVAEGQVEARTRAMLSGPLGRLVDLGTGTGRMLELLGAHASHALGVDRSPEMLRFARAKLAGLPVELRQGDVTTLPLPDASGDTAVLHQVLHYLPEPQAALAEAARILAPGGRLLIVDFAAHAHEELRTRDAHARLGFTDAQIVAWAEAAGLELSATDALEGELTVKLWLLAKPALEERLAA